MKSVFKNILAGASFLLMAWASEAHAAGLFVEPALTYQTSTSSVKYPTLSDSSGKVDGLGLAGRVGFHAGEAFLLGLDARYSMPRFSDSSTNYEAKAVEWLWGPFVGIQMPNVGLRLWASYVLGGELNPEQSGLLDVKFSEASGYRIGVGFHIAAISANLEYQDTKYGRTTVEQWGPFAVGTNFDNTQLTNKAWIASVSFPIEL